MKRTTTKSTARKGRAGSKKTAVLRAADGALKQYRKTFADLARYDRGERVLNPVSR